MKLRRVQCMEAEIIADAPSVQRQAFCIIASDPVRNRSSRSVRNGKIRFNERTDLLQGSLPVFTDGAFQDPGEDLSVAEEPLGLGIILDERPG